MATQSSLREHVISVGLRNVDASDLKGTVENKEQIGNFFGRIDFLPGPALHNAATLF